MRGRGAWVIALGLVALALLVGRAISTIAVDHAWYAALGASAVWQQKVISLALLKGGAWLLGSGFVFANLWSVRRTIRAIAVPARVGDLDFIEVIPANRLLSATLLVSAMIGVLFTVPLDDWTILAMAWEGQPFVEYEGYFQRDLGFYVYWLPFENAVYTWALVVIVVVTALITVLYSITRDLRLVNRQIIASTHVRRHLTALGSSVLLLLAWSYRLDAYELLMWGSGFDGLFNRVDHVYTMRIDIALAITTLAAALIVLRAGWIGQIRAAFVTVTLVLIGTLLLRQAGPTIVQSAALVGVDSAQNRDYEATRALFTRRAFHVEGMRFLSAPEPSGSTADSGGGGTTPATRDAIGTPIGDPISDEVQRARRVASSNVALWDADVLTRLRGPGESSFTGVVPPVWQAGPEGPQAVIVTRSAATSPVWDVRVVQGTSAGPGGEPLLTRHQELGNRTLPEPMVAPDLSDHLVIRGDALATLREADVGLRALRQSDDFSSPSLPAAELHTMGARLAHAWMTRDVSLLSDEAEGEEVAVILHRDVRARVQRIVPALTQGSALTPIIHAGGLVWAIDLYSASDRYPLSLRFLLAGAPRSYFRLAGLALVDAQTGRVTIVPSDTPDPIARTQFQWVEELLLARAELPAAVRLQLPIPHGWRHRTAAGLQPHGIGPDRARGPLRSGQLAGGHPVPGGLGRRRAAGNQLDGPDRR